MLQEMLWEIFARKAAGNLVANSVGNLAGNAVGNAVGNLAGNAVGNSVGNLVRNAVGNCWQFLACFLPFLSSLKAIKHYQTIFFS